jgi:hypothetical protein
MSNRKGGNEEPRCGFIQKIIIANNAFLNPNWVSILYISYRYKEKHQNSSNASPFDHGRKGRIGGARNRLGLHK